MKLLLTLGILFFFTRTIVAQDSTTLSVHFLYGSKPKSAYKTEEGKWFGGIHGGHAGIQISSGKIVSFLPYGSFHVFAHKKEIHGQFLKHSEDQFYSILGGEADSNKQLIIEIPISLEQKHALTVSLRRT